MENIFKAKELEHQSRFFEWQMNSQRMKMEIKREEAAAAKYVKREELKPVNHD